MAFCENCGSEVGQRDGFCPSCGKPIGATNQDTAPAFRTSAATASPSGSSGLTSNLAGALAYVLGFVTGIIFLLVQPYKQDRFVRFHAMQSIFFSVGCIAFSIAWSIFVDIIMNVSISIGLVTMPIRMMISLGFFVLWLYAMYQAYNQREFRIPLIGALAAKQVG